MASGPKEQEPQAGGVGCGCLLLVAVVVAAFGYRVFIFKGEEEPPSQVPPTSTTLALDEAADMACWRWRHLLEGGPFFGKDELSARIDWVMTTAQESSVWTVANAAEQYDQASTMQELETASDAFDRACAMVGE